MHWQRWQRNGDPLVTIPSIGTPPVDPWTRIDQSAGPDECWPWTGRTDKDGYGYQKIRGKGWRVPRWVLSQSVELTHSIVTRHTCDNPICCNPAHLVPGTPADNTRDMVSRNRHIHGEDHWTAKDSTLVQGVNNGEAKLTETQVLEIRRLYAAGGWTQKHLGHRYGVDQATISSITRRATWKHLPDAA